MKRRILATALTLCLTLSLVPTAAFAAGDKTFDDVNGHWGQASVERWAGYGVLNGDDFGNFNPDKQMTRAEFATMLANMMGYTAKANSSFGDVASDAWYADAILKLAAAGVMLGDNNGNANPNKPISRAEAAVMLCRAFNIQPSNAGLDFADSGDVADWAKGSMAALAEKGMMNGVGNNQLAPLANITRASVARLVDNMVSEYVTESKEITGTVDGIVLVVGNAEVTVKDATLNENRIVAPKAEGAEVTITGNTTASDVYVDAAASVKVDAQASAGEVQLSAPKAAAEVAGKADTVTTTAAATEATVTVAKDATVSKVEVAAPNTGLNVAGKVENVNVASTATGAEVKTESGATVSNVTTSANDVKVSGNGKVENVTANGGTAAVTTPGTTVENKTDSADNVTAGGKPVPPSTGGTTTPTTPSGGSGGSGSSGTRSDYPIRIVTTGQGTITTDPATPTEAGKVTVNVTPADGWKLTTLTITVPGEEATNITQTNGVYSFAIDSEKKGEYVVNATFVQPCGGVVANMFGDLASVKAWLKENGVTATDEAIDSMLNTNFGTPSEPWLFIYLKKGTDAVSVVPGTALSFTVDGKTTTATWGQTKGEGNLFSVWVGGTHTSQDVLSFDGSAGNIVVTATVDGVTYTSNEVKYVQKDVDESNLVNVTIENGSGTPTTTQKLPEEKVPLIKPTVDGKYFTGWTVKVGTADATSIAADVTEYTVPNNTPGKTNIVITAQFKGINTVHGNVRVAGDPNNFDYGDAYESAGISYNTTTGVITVDQKKAVDFITGNNTTAKTNITKYSGSLGADALFIGIAVPAPTNATSAVIGNKTLTFPSVDNAGHDIFKDSNGKCYYIEYYPAIKADGAIADPTNEPWETTIVWKDSNGILQVDKLVVSRGETTPVNYTVTFKNGETVLKTETVAYNGTVTPPTEIPSAEGKGFLGWVDGSESNVVDFKTAKITKDTTFNAKWDENIAKATNVAASVASGVPSELGITAQTSNGVVTITIPSDIKAKYDSLDQTKKDALKHGDRLYIRVNSDVPSGYSGENCKFVGSTDNGVNWRAELAVTKEALNSKGIDVTMDGTTVKTIGQWFSFATVGTEDNNFTLTTPSDYTVLYRWTNASGVMQYNTFQVKFVNATATNSNT